MEVKTSPAAPRLSPINVNARHQGPEDFGTVQPATPASPTENEGKVLMPPALEKIEETENVPLEELPVKNNSELTANQTAEGETATAVPREDITKDAKKQKKFKLKLQLSRIFSKKCALAPFLFVKNKFHLVVSRILFILSAYFILWDIFGRAAMPFGIFFDYIVLISVSYLIGRFFKLFSLPPLIGMLLGGFILRIINDRTRFKFVDNLNSTFTGVIGNFCVGIILTRVGVSIDLLTFKKLRYFPPMILGIVPCLVQAIIASLMIFGIYRDNIILSFALGSAISAGSTAVNVPLYSDLQSQRYGVKKGIPTVIMSKERGEKLAMGNKKN